MALIAPRGLMLSTATTEGASNPWGIEQAYHVSKKVYEFLGAEKNIAIRSRYGLHSICARDMEDYIDFFDFIFKRNNLVPENKLFYDYTFEKWLTLSGEKLNPSDFPVHKPDEKLVENINTPEQWKLKKPEITGKILWALGDEPPGVTNPGPGSLENSGGGEENFGSFLSRPKATPAMGRMNVTPYRGFGDQLFGYLYYPQDAEGKMKGTDLPVVIYLHEYDYSKGFNSYHRVESLIQSIVDKGFAVFTYDMIGFGNRIEEGMRFYHRYPHWSKMGKMVADIKGAVDALSNFNFIDPGKIIVAGYSVGATAGLYAAVKDNRIAGVVSVAGFTPMRTNTRDKGTEGLAAWSHLHGLIPRLGFFIGNESRLPYDFSYVLAAVAPRPLLVIAPEFDKDANLDDIHDCMKQVEEVYALLGQKQNAQLYTPFDINRFSPEMRDKMLEWLEANFQTGK